jgi:phosphotransferase system enzyme I (PtsI)
MPQLKCFPVSPGYADGIAIICDFEIERKIEVRQRQIPSGEIESEYERLADAVEESHRELRETNEATRLQRGRFDSRALIAAHSHLVDEVAAKVKQHVGQELVNLEQAIPVVIAELVERLLSLDSIYLREREIDVRDVGRRLQRHLSGSLLPSRELLPAGAVVVTPELMPSEAIALAHSGLAGIVAEQGGKYSHTAILAQSLGIPAVSGISNVTSRIQPGARVLVDGQSGRVTIDPSPAEVELFSASKRDYERHLAATVVAETLPCVTSDGIEISLLANIGCPEEADQVVQHNLLGAGLFRTEFLFLESPEQPSLEAQLAIYQQIAQVLEERPLVIRTFDLGADKRPAFLLSRETGTHPNLHLRGLRFSLTEQRLLETQLRAIVLAAQAADVRILFPMVVGSDDFARAAAAVDSAIQELGVLRRPPIGVMIETPAALFALEEILEQADFVAIGTNDLTQYLLAADRDVAEVIDDCTPWHPAVLRAIKQVVDAAAAKRLPVCVCGEEAAEPSFACLLAGLGIRELSLSPFRAAAVRGALRGIDSEIARSMAQEALLCGSAEQVRRLFLELPTAPASTARTNLAR